MSSRRDWLLQQMGITQYRLRRPGVLRGEGVVALSPEMRLLVVASVPPPLADPLFGDILRAMRIEPHQVTIVTPAQRAMLPEDTRYICWCLGTEYKAGASVVHIASPSLAELYQNVGAKKALWQQIFHHESDFFIDGERS